MKFNKIFKKWRVIILILFLVFSFITINPQFGESGVVIKSIDTNSTAADSGMSSPLPESPQTKRERILSVNSQKITTIEDYANAISSISEDEVVRIQTNIKEYAILKKSEDIGVTVEKSHSNNLKKGLELQGGTRVLLKPEGKITDQERDDVIAVMNNRLNTYGLTDIKIKKADDLLGNKYILVEIAGASKQEVKDLVASQGKFEAKIAGQTVFEGGAKDITFVCRNDGTCSGIQQCNDVSSGSLCEFQFTITLSPEAAKRHADITRDIPINISETGQEYLTEKIDFLLDGVIVDSLNIGASLKGQEATQIAISGPGFGSTQQEAVSEAVQQMNKLQTILITGSLPTKLEIVKLDSISPSLGSEFINNAIKTGLFALLAVAIIVFIRYRSFKVAIPMMIVAASEVFIILGFAALFKYNLDLAAIAGIIAAVGTGVDDQIVIIDEAVAGAKEQLYKWKDKIKRAFFIIMAAYFTTLAAMIPLLKAGAGLLTGFAIVTIAGISIGVFITRPAFAAIIQTLFEE